MAASREAAPLRGAPGSRLVPGLGGRHLAARAAAGDRRAFEKIFERHHQELYRYCLAIVRNPADAEDALQATMSKALQALPGESRRIELRPWLFRVAHNESISIIRGRRVEVQGEVQGKAEELSEPGAEVAAEHRDRLRTLVRDLQELPERQRSALVMRELSDLSYREIGTALGSSEGSARQTVYEARQALQVREEGRSMECTEARRALSDGDRRRLRNRRLRAHLSACDGCSAFQAAIAARRADLRALTPPLPLAAAASLLGGIAGSGTAATAGGGIGAAGAGAGTVAGGLAGGAAAKGASAVAAVVLAAGVADATGVVDFPTPLGDRGERAAEPAPSDEVQRGSGTNGSRSEAQPPAQDHGKASRGSQADGGAESGTARGRAKVDGGRKNGANSPGRAGTTPGQSGSSPGRAGTTPGQSGSTPGQSGSTPADGAAPPGQSGTSPGQSSSTPGASSSTPPQGALPSGQSSASPGSSAPPGQLKKP